MLEYHQSAYNTLAAVIRCTQTKENFFNVFLFKETWDNIIDTKTRHIFQVETNFPVARQFVASLRLSDSKEDKERKSANSKGKQSLLVGRNVIKLTNHSLVFGFVRPSLRVVAIFS